MVSTFVDESKLLKLLDVAPTPKNSRELQAGAFLLVLDAFDRKVTRENFAVAVNNAMRVYDAVGRMALATNIRQFLLETGAVTAADIIMCEQGCEALVKQASAECIKMANALAQCSNDGDPIS